MLRENLARRRDGDRKDFRWRGEEVSRLESFSDAVFAFAITLLVVSLEVPDTFEELLAAMQGFFAFSICFALLMLVWYDHIKFVRRFGLRDRLTVCLNAALLFILLFYVYPLKFLFTLLMDEVFGFGAETITPEQIPQLMVIYGAGFVAVQLVFMLLYFRAYSLRRALELDAPEVSVTREEIQGFCLNMGIGLLSVCIALLGGAEAAGWAGAAYLLTFPLQTANSRFMRARRAKTQAAEKTGVYDENGGRGDHAAPPAS